MKAMAKTQVQIDRDLFFRIVKYFDTQDDDLEGYAIHVELLKKATRILEHDLFTQYKQADDAQKRKALAEYNKVKEQLEKELNNL